jgi:hypothetical protein
MAASKLTDDPRGRLALAASGAGMVVGGILVAIVSSTWRVVGISVALAGVAGLATLLPPVQAWITARTSRPPAAPAEGPPP